MTVRVYDQYGKEVVNNGLAALPIAESDVTALVADLAGKCSSTDSRLSDARTPTTHASTHQNGGADEIATATAAANAIPKAGGSGKLDKAWLPTMVASGASHAPGAVPDPPSTSGTVKFLREDATWATPAGGGGGSQTPLLSDVDAAGHSITHLNSLQFPFGTEIYSDGGSSLHLVTTSGTIYMDAGTLGAGANVQNVASLGFADGTSMSTGVSSSTFLPVNGSGYMSGDLDMRAHGVVGVNSINTSDSITDFGPLNIQPGSNLYIGNTVDDGSGAFMQVNGGVNVTGDMSAYNLTLSGTVYCGTSLHLGSSGAGGNDGDMWFDGTNLYIQIAGNTMTVTVT